MKLWTGETVSVLGTSITQLALPTLAILVFHAGPFQVGLLGALVRLPFAVLALPAGAWIDRLRRRNLMIVCDLGRVAALGFVPVAAALGILTLTQLYVVAVVVGIFTVFFDIAYLAYLPALIGEDDLLEGNQKLEVSYAVSSVAGPGLAGLLISAFGAARAIGADAASYLASAVALLWIRERESPPPASEATFWHDLAEGLRFTFGHSVLGTMLLGMAGLIFGSHAAETVTYVYVYGPLQLTPAILGAILTIGGLGAIVGAVTSGFVARRVGTGRTVALTGIVSGLMFGMIPISQVLPAVPTLVV
ncbi:MAG TPA: MFS transporter, partial [Solirubrobacterales bacterium]|nr:MFS transporter [Solirubrobacterales bacterium]